MGQEKIISQQNGCVASKEQPSNVNTIIFNSPMEIALRLLFIVSQSTRALDLDRLVHYHYLLLHSSDAPSGPPSIHPNLPFRSCEFLIINRKIIKQGLNLLVLKDLISINYSSETGISYLKNNKTEEFIKYFQCSYSELLVERANWVCLTFDKFTDAQVNDLIDHSLGKWGSEFSLVPLNDEVKT